MIGGSEAWYSISVTGEYMETECDDVPMIEFEQKRFAEFLAAQEDELPQFQSDRKRIAAWLAGSCVADEEVFSNGR